MAYVDAELSEADSRDIELFLAGDPQARETVERYRQTRSAIDQFADILDDPVPEHLIDTIRQHEPQPNVVQLPVKKSTGGLWMAVAASLLVGISLGAITTNYLVVKPSKEMASSAISKIDELSGALETMKIKKEAAEKNVELAERNSEAAGKAAADAATAAKSTIDDIRKALKTAQAEKKQAQEQVLAANAEKAKYVSVEEIEGIFPIKLVSEAIENGSKLSSDAEKVILSGLNKKDVPTTTASSFSKLIRKPTDKGLTTGTSQYEALSDLQPVEKPSVGMSGGANEVLGEFTYSEKTCRLIKFLPRSQADAYTLVACRDGSGIWNIVRRR